MAKNTDAALVVLSGGQDSTICLAWALARYNRVETISFDYGQRHKIELDCAARLADLCNVAHRVVAVSSLSDLGGNALTDSDTAVETMKDKPSEGEPALPNTFVPGRNLVFMTLAAAYAWQRDITDLVTGVCETDFSGYPDCREATMKALQAALRAGIDAPFTIHTPLMFIDKAESIRLMQSLGQVELFAHTHTCYNGQRPPCGTCPACVLRAKGFAEAGIDDPLIS